MGPFYEGPQLVIQRPVVPQAPQPCAFSRTLQAWIQEQIAASRQSIEDRRAEYRRQNWGGVEADDRVQRYRRRITLLEDIQREWNAEMTGVVGTGCEEILVLANVIYNEAGSSNDPAKRAIAYAWLNRTNGVVREPVGAEISHYEALTDRWNGFDLTDRLTFVQQFVPSVRAARRRLSDAEPRQNDPTGGATHWVSPQGLPEFVSSR